MGTSCNKQRAMIKRDMKTISKRFSTAVHLNIMLFGYGSSGKTTLQRYYLQQQDPTAQGKNDLMLKRKKKGGQKKNQSSFDDDVDDDDYEDDDDDDDDYVDKDAQDIVQELPEDGLRFLKIPYQHTENCSLGLKIINLQQVVHPVSIRIFDTPGRDKTEQFFIPGERVLFRNIDWALLVINPENTIINQDMVNSFKRYVEKAQHRALLVDSVKFRLVIVVEDLSKMDLLLERDLDQLVENSVIDKWSLVALDRSHKIDPLLIEMIKDKVDFQEAWDETFKRKVKLKSLKLRHFK